MYFQIFILNGLIFAIFNIGCYRNIKYSRERESGELELYLIIFHMLVGILKGLLLSIFYIISV